MNTLKLLTTALILNVNINVSAQSEFDKKIPPMKDLPKIGESKTFYQLPESYEYQVYDSLGKFIKEGIGEFIDVTDFVKGNYFIVYANQKVLYRKEN